MNLKRALPLFLLAFGCAVAVPACKTGAGNANSGSSGGGNTTSHTARPVKPDAEFAQEAVNGLLNGDVSYADTFDWDNLKVPGADAGAAYRNMPDDTNRKAFQEAFIKKFSESFKKTGATTSSLSNWHESGKNGEATIITTETKTGKKLSVSVVRKDGQQKVSEIAIQ